jgi:hypothetical protein
MQRAALAKRCFAPRTPVSSSQVTVAPALQRTAPQGLRAALRPGARKRKIICSRTCECIPIPALRTALIVHSSCPRGGASRGDPEVGQSESWPEGQPEGRCGAWGRASQARCREALGFRPALERGSATVSWLDGDRRAAQKRRAQGPLRGSAKSPEERTRVLRRRGGTSEGVPRPLFS